MSDCKDEALTDEDIQNVSNSINCNSADDLGVKLNMECDVLEERLDSEAKSVFKKVNDVSRKNRSGVQSKTRKKSSKSDASCQLNKAFRTKMNAKVSKENKVLLSNASTSVKKKKGNNKSDISSNVNNAHTNAEKSVEEKPEMSVDTNNIAYSKTNGSVLNKASPKKRKIISIQEYHRKRLRIIDFLQFKQEISFISINSQIISFSKKTAYISASFNSEGIYLELPRFKICKGMFKIFLFLNFLINYSQTLL